jgi:hypothetical protein
MEYANAAITIGGKIKRSDVEKLAYAIADDNAGIDWSDTLDPIDAVAQIEDCADAKRHLYFCASEQPWGRFEALEAICAELGLTHKTECEAGGDWSPLLQFWQPGMIKRGDDGKDRAVPREWSIAEIGRGPMIDAEEIQAMLDASTLADELALMTAVHKFPWPLEIVEDEPDLTAVTRDFVEGGSHG